MQLLLKSPHVFWLFPQVTSPTRPCPLQGFFPGSRASSATPTTPASDIQPEESLQASSPTTTTQCKPDRGPLSHLHRHLLINTYKSLDQSIRLILWVFWFDLDWHGSMLTPRSFCSMRPKSSSLAVSGTTCRPFRTLWMRYATTHLCCQVKGKCEKWFRWFRWKHFSRDESS